MLNTKALTPARHGFWAWPTLVAVVLALASPAFAQPVAPAPAPAPVAPPPAPVAPGVAPAPAPVPYGQPAPAPYYGQQPYPGQPYAQPVYVAPPPQYAPPPPRYRPRLGLMIGGIALFGASYIVTAVSGAVLMDLTRESCAKCKDVGPLLLIPIAGPFIAIPEAKTGDAFLVLSGIFQIAGVGLTVGGAILYSQSKRRAEQGMYTFRLPEGRSLSLDMSTSPMRLGPSALLRF